jgi:hypothetical protein
VRDGQARLANAVSAAPPTDSTLRALADVEAALLDADHLAAVKLALKTKRLPLTADDLARRQDETLPLYERYASGLSEIPLSEYYAPYVSQCDFPRETVRTVEFLVANRRAFKERSTAGINDVRQVEEFARLCHDENQLRALFVFTCADRTEWETEETEPTRWFNTRELYAKTLQRFRPAGDPTRLLMTAGYSPEQLSILQDFGEDFFSGVYCKYAVRFGAHLVRLAEEPTLTSPNASILRDGSSTIVCVAARDYRGLAASISGAFWQQKIDLRQAHLFSAMHHGLALDFFHLPPRDKPLTPDLTRFIEEAIQRRLYIGESDEWNVPRIAGVATLREWRAGLCCLRFETAQEASGLIYALTYKIFRHLRGNIFGLTAHTARGRGFVSVYHNLPQDLSLAQAQAMTAKYF